MLGYQRIAYQLIGDGPVEVLIAPFWSSAFDIGGITRRSGTFSSDWPDSPVSSAWIAAARELWIRWERAVFPWEEFAEDIKCVMDAVDSESAFV